MGELIDKVAALTGMKVVVIDAHFPSSYSKYQVFYDIDPLEFLGLFANASFVITNSFHGTSFSTIFRKDFLLIASKQKVLSPGHNVSWRDLGWARGSSMKATRSTRKS
jgi:exopolysaccharide biosynthesis predicted pyruvyltransferase EpsI